MLEKLVIGWEKIEPLFLVNIALNKPFILLGKHGTCKTTCAKEIAKLYGNKTFRFYDATKDDLISIAGIPIPQKLAKGKLEFSEHDRSIWKAKVIVIDELTRANRENQNLWLEILEEKTCFGKKLCYEVLIATMNPESYAATFKLDEALLDRFYAVVPVPDLQKGTSSDIFKKVIKKNLEEHILDNIEMKKLMHNINLTYVRLLNNKTIIHAVSEYVSNYIEILLSKVDSYISPRKTVHLVEEILALASYFLNNSTADYLTEAAKTALLYVLGIPFKIKPEILMQIHANLKSFLLKNVIDKCERIRIDLAKLSDKGSVLQYARKNIRRINKYLPFDEMEKLLAHVIEKSEDNDLLILRNILGKTDGHEELKRIIQGRIVFYELDMVDKVQKMLRQYEIVNEQDFETMEKVKSFIQILKRLSLNEKTERLLFKRDVCDKEIIRFIKRGGYNGNEPETCSGMQRTGTEPA